MSNEQRRLVLTEIRQSADALDRALDGFEQLPEGGITSLTYTARQLAIALRHIAAACEPIMREIDG